MHYGETATAKEAIGGGVPTAPMREQSSYLSFQLGRTVWFRHQANFFAQCLGGLRGLRDAGSENDFNGRP